MKKKKEEDKPKDVDVPAKSKPAGSGKPIAKEKVQASPSKRIETDNFIRDYIRKQKPTKKKFYYMTKQIADEVDRECVIKACLRDLTIYTFYLICSAVLASSIKSEESYYMKRGLLKPIETSEFLTDDDRVITFETMFNIADIWHFIDNVLLDLMYNELYYDRFQPIAPIPEEERNILFSHFMIGIPRLRQVRSRNNSCGIHPAASFMFETCFDSDLIAGEDKSPFGLGEPTAWTYSDAKKTTSLPYSGKFGLYDGGGYYQNLAKDRDTTKELLDSLKQNVWITRETRAVFLDFSLFNIHASNLAHVKVAFEISVTGDIKTKCLIDTLPVQKHTSFAWQDVFEVAFFVFIIYLLFEEIIEIMYFRWRYLRQVWAYLDLTLIILPSVSLRYYINLETEAKDFAHNIRPNEYENVEHLMNDQLEYNRLIAWTLILQYVRIFKYMNVNKTIGQINLTIKRSTNELLSFMVMFFIIFCAYADVGHILFGEDSKDYNSFTESLFTLFRTILGDFSYTALQHANATWAGIFFISYILLVFFILTNMFLAIISDSYAEVKTEIAIAPDEIQFSEYLTKLCNKMCKRKKQEAKLVYGYKQIINEIKVTLKKCGYSDIEIQMLFTRFNIDPYAKLPHATRKSVLETLANAGLEAEQSKTKVVRPQDFFARLDRLEDIESNADKLLEKMELLYQRLDETVVQKK